MSKRPDNITYAHLEFLDELRDSGTTNMYGASEYIENEFVVSKKESRAILGYWMETFGKANR